MQRIFQTEAIQKDPGSEADIYGRRKVMRKMLISTAVEVTDEYKKKEGRKCGR